MAGIRPAIQIYCERSCSRLWRTAWP